MSFTSNNSGNSSNSSEFFTTKNNKRKRCTKSEKTQKRLKIDVKDLDTLTKEVVKNVVVRVIDVWNMEGSYGVFTPEVMILKDFLSQVVSAGLVTDENKNDTPRWFLIFVEFKKKVFL